jgi:twinkle protein
MRVLTLDDISDLDQYLAENPSEVNVQPAWMLQKAVIDKMYGAQANIGADLPWSKTHGLVRLRPGEVSVWAGVNGHGKSLVLNQVMLSCMEQGERVVIASMEMPPVSTMMRMVKQAAGRNNPSERFIEDFHNWTENKLWLYDQVGTVSSKIMLAVIRYCAKSLRSAGERMPPHHFVIDSLMKCGMGVDEYNKQKWFIDSLTAIAKDYNMHIHIVAHSRKRENEKGIMDKFDIKGAGEITDMADNVFTVWRNKTKEHESKKPNPSKEITDQPDCIVNCDKQRHGEWEGRISLWHHPSGQFVSGPDKAPIPHGLTKEMAGLGELYNPA